jgi:hypothetical protein
MLKYLIRRGLLPGRILFKNDIFEYQLTLHN